MRSYAVPRLNRALILFEVFTEDDHKLILFFQSKFRYLVIIEYDAIVAHVQKIEGEKPAN